jgi:hypothetical protein
MDDADLKRVAEAATPGPWVAEAGADRWWIGRAKATPDALTGLPRVADIHATVEGGGGQGYREEFVVRQAANATFICTFDPPTALSLLSRLSAAEAEAEDLRERLRDVVMIDAEAFATGGGPGFKERKEKAWNRAREPFEP